MANPLKIKSSGATFQGLQMMTDAEMDYAADVILRDFAATNTGLGTVNIDGINGTSIGTFVDTSRSGAVGDHPVLDSPTTVATYTFKQVITPSATESLTRPIEYSSTGIRQQNDTQLNDSIINHTLTALTTSSRIGKYVLQPISPGGTWISIGTITNSVIGATNTSTLWRKTSGTPPATVRPLKYKTSPTKSVQEMTDAEIQSLTNRFRNRIIATGIGTYRLQTSAPSPGTWITAGSAFDDTRNNLANENFTGNYTGSYTGNYTGNYAGTYFRPYAGTYSGAFTGSYAGSYQRFFAGFSGGFFTGFYTGFFTGFFTGTYTATGAGAFAGTYTGSYSSNFAGAYQRFFAGFSGGFFTGFYTGFFTGNYTGFYTAAGFTGFYAGTYTGTYSGTYSGTYVGQTIQASAGTISTVSLWVRTA